MTENRVNELQRLRYWQGQKLLSRDFRDQVSYESELRWWHNRALHNSYGVSYGFEVSLDDSHVEINCGVAYDCYGRELILQVPKRIALPEPDDDFVGVTLVAAFAASDQHFTRKEVLMGTVDCSDNRLAPTFYWKPTRCYALVEGVPLAEITYEPSATLESLPPTVRFPPAPDQKVFYDAEKKLLIAIDGLTPTEADELKKLSDDPAFVAAIDKLVAADERSPVLNAHFVAHRARGLTRPRIGSGSTVPGDTAWDLWTQIVIDPQGHKIPADLGVQVTVDTSGAGFTETPCYFAWLQGTLWDQVHLSFFPVPIVHIDRESMRRFRLRLWLPPIIAVLGARIRFANIDPNIPRFTKQVQPRSFVTDFGNFARQQKLYVCWMGIQEMVQPQCEPLADCECETVGPVVEEERIVEARRNRRRVRQERRTIRRQLIVEDLR
jgi:hypothetical protein